MMEHRDTSINQALVFGLIVDKSVRNAVRTAKARNWNHHVDFSSRTPGSVLAFPLLGNLSLVTTSNVASTLLLLYKRACNTVFH
jgi:hypothetical protein